MSGPADLIMDLRAGGPRMATSSYRGTQPSGEISMSETVAHSMLGTVAAVRRALDPVMASGVDGEARDSVMLLAVGRLDPR